MAGKDKKTEHSGAKKGKGAYWGHKKDAKGESKKSRRQQDKRESKKVDEGLDTNSVVEEALTGKTTVKESLDLDTLGELIDMARESAELEGEVEVTPEVEKLADEFEHVLDAVLTHWVEKHPDAMMPGVDAYDLIDAGEAGYNVLMTLRGEGVGIWDGRWDNFFRDRKDIEELQQYLKKILGEYVDRFETAFMNAAYETAGSGDIDEHNTNSVLEDAMDEDSWSRRAGKHPGVRGMGYDFDANRHMEREVMIGDANRLAAQLLDFVVDPADVSNEEALAMAQDIVNKHQGETLQVYDLERLVREYGKTRR